MTQEEFLIDGLEYFTADPFTRRCTQGKHCQYTPFNDQQEGCWIGRKLPQDLAVKLDNEVGGGVNAVFEFLPDDMKKLGKRFLSYCQVLHDVNNYWEKDGLSEVGKRYLLEIIERFKLNPKLFEKYA